MRPNVFRLILAIIPAIFAFFLVSTFTMVLWRDVLFAALAGIGASLASAATILRH